MPSCDPGRASAVGAGKRVGRQVGAGERVRRGRRQHRIARQVAFGRGISGQGRGVEGKAVAGAGQRAAGRDQELLRPARQALGQRRLAQHRLEIGASLVVLARLEPREGPLFEGERAKGTLGSDERLERREPLGAVHLRAEHADPLQQGEVAVDGREASVLRHRSEDRRGACPVAGLQQRACLGDPGDRPRPGDILGRRAERVCPRPGRLHEIGAPQRLAGLLGSRLLARLAPLVEACAADEDQDGEGTDPAVAPEQRGETFAANLLGDLADEGISFAQSLPTPSCRAPVYPRGRLVPSPKPAGPDRPHARASGACALPGFLAALPRKP
jgi:hypothetical protein